VTFTNRISKLSIFTHCHLGYNKTGYKTQAIKEDRYGYSPS
jgi:hypothetical protein